MDFGQIKNIVDILNESMSFVNNYGVYPLDKGTLEKFHALQSRLKTEFNALDIEMEFLNSSRDEANFYLTKLDEYLYKPANAVKMMLVKQEELVQRRNTLIERLRNEDEEVVIIHYNAEIFQQIMSFRYDIELYADSIIVQVDKLCQMCSNPKGVSQLQHEERYNEQKEITLPDELNTDEAKQVFSEAVKAGLMQPLDDGIGYKWHRSNALLAYLTGKIYCGDKLEQDTVTREWIVKRGSAFFPETSLMSFFVNKDGQAIKNLGQSRFQLERPPKGYEDVNRLFDEAT